MSLSEVMADVVDYLKVLRAADVGQIRTALGKIISDIQDEDLRLLYTQHGLVEALRDLSTSKDPSVCHSVLSALNLLAHDNTQVKLRLLRPMGFLLQLINFCSATNHQLTGQSCGKDMLHIHEQAAGLIRKLVLNSECMSEVASFDVIRHMIELCGIFFNDSQHKHCCLGVSQFPPRATSYLHELAHGKQLIGKVREFSPNASKKIVEDCKSKVKEMLPNDPAIGVVSVDLYDTTTDQDVVMREEILKEGLAWPQFLTSEEETKIFIKQKIKGNDEHVWADINVTCVLDGGHFWAQVGGDVVYEKLKEIREALQNKDLARLDAAPKIGGLVCYKTMVGGHQDIYRGKVLEVISTPDGTLVEVFAVDYGFKNIIAAECLRKLPALGQKEPFQARFCCLSGVQAPPCDAMVLESAAGVLRNLAYGSNACRLQITEKDGVDALLKLCVVPDKSISTQAVAAILNLSINFKTRARIGFLGGVKVLLEIIQNYLHKDMELVCLAVGALRNLMLDAPVNRGRVAENDGLPILTHVYFTCTDTNVKQQCLGALKNLVGNSSYMLNCQGGVDLRSIVDEKYSKPFSLAVAPDKPTIRMASHRRRSFRLRRGEVEPKPIEKALPSHVIKSADSSCEDSDKERRNSLSQEENTDGDTDNGDEGFLIPSPVAAQEPGTDLKMNEDCSNFYVKGQAVTFYDDELHELRECKAMTGLSSAVISRPACAFLNAGEGGTVYMGIKRSGLVSGVEVGRKDRDRLRLGIDELLGAFKPVVRYDKYQVNFVPVAKNDNKRRTTIELIPDAFVVEVVFNKCSGTVYSTSKNRCYFRCGAKNSEFSTQDIRKWVIRDQEALYNNEIKSLRKELSETRTKLAEEGL